MRAFNLIFAAAFAAMVPAAVDAEPAESHPPGIGHTLFMRGTVVRASGAELVVCIGRADGATVGQELTVYRVVRSHGGAGKGPPNFRRDEVGKVRIGEIINDHFARVSTISGRIRRNDIVELRRS